MSYQPQSPMGGPPPMGSPMPGVAAAPPAKKGKLLPGIIVAVVGIVAGVVLLGLSGSTKEATVKKFARAPVGCTTTLEFTKKATFTFYIETKGKADDVGGDCAGNGGSYDRSNDDLPKVSLALTDDADKAVDLASSTAFSYDTGAYKGKAVEKVTIDQTGTYRLTVTSDDKNFAVAVGGDPSADSSTMAVLGLGVAVLGLVLGLLLIVLGRRKKGAVPAAPAWQPQAQPATVPGWQPQPQPQPYAPAPAPQPGYPQAPTSPPYQPPAPPTSPPYQPPAPPSGPWDAPHQ
jgi:hypothetical protein